LVNKSEFLGQLYPPSAPNLFVSLCSTKRISAQVGLQHSTLKFRIKKNQNEKYI